MQDSSNVISSETNRLNRVSRLPILSDKDLLSVQKPAQYLGGELNSIVKSDTDVDVHFALCFPDTYEVGMSHLGLQILYSILNADPHTWAERAYMPQADMEALLRQKQIPLSSLEGKRPLQNFDILGFSLQYELCGTNILAMLELSGLSFYAAERPDSAPLVIGGGPYSYHPEALAPFFDAFLLGDAEEAVLEVVAAVRESKSAGKNWSRSACLERIRQIEGVYIPADFTPHYDSEGRYTGINPEGKSITRRLLPSLVNAPYPKKPLVPNVQTVHNRLAVEVMRGCVRGCRFCQAGYLYRPQRERSPKEIVEMVGSSLEASGFEELSLLSLSTADYCSIVPLLKTLMDNFAADDKLAISFPSTRVDALTPEVLEQVQRVRRTGFTVAPEGGTQRLRDVINKGVSDEQILETCKNVFSMGWTGIKLYFMLGLPTETDEDLRGIIDIARRARALPESRGKEITVSVSTLVPKPHTPFQWAQQISPEETVRRQRLLADGLREARVNFRYHDSFSSFLEGVFCRAGREIAPAIVRAYELGCRLDAWQDHLKEEIWLQAFLDCDIDPNFYLRERSVEEPLPWDHLSCGIPKSYFLKEWQRATRFRPTPDCLKTSCSICGACNYDDKRNVLWPREETEALAASSTQRDNTLLPHALRSHLTDNTVLRLRIRYRKAENFRYLGHLELVGIFHRAARRANIPLSFTQGFHPMPKLSFGPPPQLGIMSQEEFVDAALYELIEPHTLIEKLNTTLPAGLEILDAKPISDKTRSIQESIIEHTYRICWLSKPSDLLGNLLDSIESENFDEKKFSEALRKSVVTRTAKKKGGKNSNRLQEKAFPLEEYVRDIHLISSLDKKDTPILELHLLVDSGRACPKLTEVIHALSGQDIGDYRAEKIATRFRPEDIQEGGAMGFITADNRTEASIC